MGRSRLIKPGFFTNDRLAEMDPLVRILFAGLWTIADREGRLEDRPKRIKAECLPYDSLDANEALDALASGPDPFILRYVVDGQPFIQILKWSAHQRPHHNESKSVLPEPQERQALTKKEQGLATKVASPSCQGSQASNKYYNKIYNKVKATSNKEGSKARARGEPDADAEAALGAVSEPRVRSSIESWLAYKRERREFYKPKGLQALATRANNLADDYGVHAVCDAIERAMANDWKGFEHDIGGGGTRGSPGYNSKSFGESETEKFLKRHSDGERESNCQGGEPDLRRLRPPADAGDP